jgi:acyl-CoA reductase-like NAD-dependent aldehyde dehydrogenase
LLIDESGRGAFSVARGGESMQETVGSQADGMRGLETARAQVRRIVCEGAASGEVLGTVDVCGGEQVQAAMARAKVAQASWAKLALEERCERLLMLRDTLVDRADDLVEVISRECGKPRQEALVHEVMMAVDLAAFYAKRAPRILAPREIDLHLFKHRKSYVHYAPVGVVAIIGPANYPMAIPAEAAITALIAGNAVLMKPSERGTLVALKLKEVFDSSGLPPDLLQVIPGDAATVLAMLDAHPDKVVFTGSQAVGRKVAALCGERLIPCTMELGGKGALIVCEDAEIERSARAIVFAGFANGGQVCFVSPASCARATQRSERWKLVQWPVKRSSYLRRRPCETLSPRARRCARVGRGSPARDASSCRRCLRAAHPTR